MTTLILDADDKSAERTPAVLLSHPRTSPEAERSELSPGGTAPGAGIFSGEPVDRKTGIGGSDIAAVLGLSKWKTAFDVWLEKTGRAPEEPERDPGVGRDPRFWGKALERKIAEVYAAREKRGALVLLFDKTIRHKSDAWHIGTPDAVETSVVTFDAKNVGLAKALEFGEEYTDQFPDEYIVQGAWYLPLTGTPTFDLAALIGGQELRIYRQNRNASLEDSLREAAFLFWRDHVQADVPPPVQDSETARAYFRSRFPKHLNPVREATDFESAAAERLAEVRSLYAEIEKKKNDLEAALKFSIGEGEGLKGADFGITWRASKPSVKVDWEAAFTALRNEIGLGLLTPPLNLDQQARDQRIARRLEEIVSKYTTTKPGTRRFIPKFTGRLLKGESDAQE